MLLKRVLQRSAGRPLFRAVQKPLLRYQSSSASTASFKSWVPTQGGDLEKIATQALIHEVSLQQFEATAKLVPWFLCNMPASYFRQVPESLRRQHSTAIGAIRELKQSDLSLKIDTVVENGGSVETTYLATNAARKGLLHAQLTSLHIPKDMHLSKVHVFSSADQALALNLFSFEKNWVEGRECATRSDAKHILDFIAQLRNGSASSSSGAASDLLYDEAAFGDAAMDEYFTRLRPSYCKGMQSARRFLIQKQMFDQIKGTHGTVVHIEPIEGGAVVEGIDNNVNTGSIGAGGGGGVGGGYWITIASANVLPQVLLQLSSSILVAKDMEVNQARLDKIQDPSSSTPEHPGYVTMLRFHATSPVSSLDESQIESLKQTLKRCKWLDDDVTHLGLIQHPSMGVEKAEIITALCSMLHGPLAKQNAQAFASVSSILSIISISPHFVHLAEAIAQLFLDRFKPTPSGFGEEEFTTREKELQAKISRLQHEAARLVLLKMLEAVRATLRTNYYHADRYALGLRVNPQIMVPSSDASKPIPFGIIFTYGRNFAAFHNRFRDIARGGLRVVTPQNRDQHALESTRHFDEAYGLSHAQQLKNKDIPEGGSKAVILVNSSSVPIADRFFETRKSIVAFTDAVLDLTVKSADTPMVDLYQKEELIYLGPGTCVCVYVCYMYVCIYA